MVNDYDYDMRLEYQFDTETYVVGLFIDRILVAQRLYAREFLKDQGPGYICGIIYRGYLYAAALSRWGGACVLAHYRRDPFPTPERIDLDEWQCDYCSHINEGGYNFCNTCEELHEPNATGTMQENLPFEIQT